MRYFLILSLVFLFFTSIAQVTIKQKTAEYFLETRDSLQIYKERDSLHLTQLLDAEEKEKAYRSALKTSKEDSASFVIEISERKLEKVEDQKTIKKLNRQLTWQKIQKVGLIVIVVIETAIIIFL